MFGELRPGQIVIVDTEGSGETAKFTFTGVQKPEVVPDAPEAEIAGEPAVAAPSSSVSSSPGNTGSQDGGGTASAVG